MTAARAILENGMRLFSIARESTRAATILLTSGGLPALMEQQFLAAAGNDLMARIASVEIDTEAKRTTLLEPYDEELERKYLEWENLQVSLVAGAGFEPAAFRL